MSRVQLGSHTVLSIHTYHLNGDPVVWADTLRNELGWQFCEEKRNEEDRLAIVVIVSRHFEVVKEIIRQCLTDVASVQLQSEEHEAYPSTDFPIDLFGS